MRMKPIFMPASVVHHAILLGCGKMMMAPVLMNSPVTQDLISIGIVVKDTLLCEFHSLEFLFILYSFTISPFFYFFLFLHRYLVDYFVDLCGFSHLTQLHWVSPHFFTVDGCLSMIEEWINLHYGTYFSNCRDSRISRNLSVRHTMPTLVEGKPITKLKTPLHWPGDYLKLDLVFKPV